MRRVLKWLEQYSLAIVLVITLLLGIYNITLRIDNNKLKEQASELKVQVATLKAENEDQKNTIIDRNQEIYRLEMIANDWEELFYAAIGFHPYEGYPYK